MNQKQIKMRTIAKTTTIIFLVLGILSACSKEKINHVPPAGGEGHRTPPAEKSFIHFSTNADLTGQAYHETNLRAVVTIVNNRGEEVVKNKTLSLSLSHPVKTENLELPKGSYKLTAFRMEYGAASTHFATPVAGSAKAAIIQHPLALDFKIEKNGNSEIPVEVLKVQSGERPEQYGYAAGAFDAGQQQDNTSFRIRLKAEMKIGNIIYDSIPAYVRITTWNNNGQPGITFKELRPGANEILVSKDASRYDFILYKWGITDTLHVSRNEMNEAQVYILGTSKAAKKLKSERVYKIINGVDMADTKTDYFYDAAGKLSKIEYWMRNKDNTAYLAMTDVFEYSNGKATGIVRTNEESQSVMSRTLFSYDQNGKVSNITQNDNGIQTNASVTYYNNIREEVKMQFTYPGRSDDMNYYMRFSGGNMTASSAATSNNSTELGAHNYDLNINPYIHMNWPNLFLSNSSKNNMTSQQKDYYGNYPVAYPYSFTYSYDGDGYPKEVVKAFKSPTSGNPVFSTRTLFIY
jgi:hypothetical protein